MEKAAIKGPKTSQKKASAMAAIDPENELEAIACISGLAGEVLTQCPSSSAMLVVLDGRDAKVFYVP